MKQKTSFAWLVLSSMIFVASSLTLSATELYVNQKDSKADDNNPGTREKPLKTISAAAKNVKPGDTVTVASGIYREAVTLTVSGEEGKPIIFKSEEPLKAVISGSDILSNPKDEGLGIYSYPIADTIRFKELGGNPQWVYMDGLPLERANTRDRLIPGTFYQDIDGKMLYVSLPEGTEIGNVTLEYACREGLISPQTALSLNDIHIIGFTLKHNADWFRGKSTIWVNGQRWLVEGNHVSWASYMGGILIRDSNKAVVRNNLIEWCGAQGIGGSYSVDLLVEGNTVRYNNWRSFDWGMEGGGSKFGNTIDACYRRNEFAFNFGPGLWNDGASAGTIYEKNICHDNTVRSIYSEVNWDEVIQDNIVYNTGDPGINISNGPGMLIRRNVIFNCNIGMGLGGNYTRPYDHNQQWWRICVDRMAKVPGINPHRVTLWEAQFLKYGVAPKACLLNNCVIWDNILFDNGIGLIENRDYRTPSAIDAFVNNFSDYNIYWAKPEKGMFSYSYQYYYDSLDAWRKASGRDEHSVFADPRDPNTKLPEWAQANRKDWDLKMRPLWEGRRNEFFSSPMAEIAVGRMLRSPYLEKVKFQDAKVRGSIFEVEGQKTLALWTSSPAERRYVRLRLDKPSVIIENGYLASKEVKLPSGCVDILVTYNPTYLRGIGEKFTESPSGIIQVQTFNIAERPIPATVSFVNEGAEAVSLKATFSATAGFAVEPASVEKQLAAGEKCEIQLVLKPDGTFRRGTGMLRMDASLGAEKIRRTAVFSVGEGNNKLPRLAAEIKVDGQLDDWGSIVKDAVPLATVNDASQYLSGPKDGWKGVADLNAKYYAAWTDKALFLALVVEDDQVITAAGSKDEWGSAEVGKSDALQISFDGRAPDMQWQKEVNKGCYDLIISPTQDAMKPAVKINNWRVGKVKDVVIATSITDKGYIVEMMIPLEKEGFPEIQLEPGRPVRLSLIIMDSDDPTPGAQRKVLGWSVSTSRRNSEDASGWATVILEGEKNR